MFYLFAKDLVAGFVGPFSTREGAGAHLEFQRKRGDAAVVVHNNTVILTEEEAEEIAARTHLVPLSDWASTPEEDRNLGALEEGT